MVYTIVCNSCGFVSFAKAPDTKTLLVELSTRTHCFGGHDHAASSQSYRIVGCELGKGKGLSEL